jgi:hypothetical protein
MKMSESFRELVGISIGRASMAWSETPRGVFDSEVCSALVDEIVVAYEKNIKRTNEVLDMQKLISNEYKDAIVEFLNLAHKDNKLSPHDARILLKTWQDLHNKPVKCLSETAPETYLKLKNKITKLESDLSRVAELLKSACEVIEFYGNENHWWHSEQVNQDEIFDTVISNEGRHTRAREFLSKPEIKEVLK